MANSIIRRLPGAEQVSGPASLRPSGANPGRDVTAQFEGQQRLAAGIDQLGQGAVAAAHYELQRERAADLAKADAEWLRGSLDIGNRYQQDGDFATFNKRVSAESLALRDRIADLPDAVCLFLRGGIDVDHQLGQLPDAGHDAVDEFLLFLVRLEGNQRIVLAAAQELARAHGVYDASDVYSGDEGEVDGVVAWAADSSSDAAMLATADLC